jgi:hypothetical protein
VLGKQKAVQCSTVQSVGPAQTDSKTTVFQDMLPCSLVDADSLEGAASIFKI